MKSLLIFAFICVFFNAQAQQRHFSYRTISRGKDFNLPIFSDSANHAVAKRINQSLQIGELELLKGHETKHIFEKVSIDRGTIYGGKVDLSFTISTNNNRLLSLKFNESSCGMTCAYWVSYYNFNAGNGDMIQLKDIFTKTGYKIFRRFATKKRILQFKKELLKLETEERKGFDEIIGSYEDDDLNDFCIKGNELLIDGENSFSKNQKFSGIETVCKFKLKEFYSYLNTYGKALFSKNTTNIADFRSNSLPQLFTGQIGTENILLLLVNNDENSFKGEYVYVKYGRGIFLEGKLNGDKLLLTEYDADFKPNGSIEAKLKQNQLVGTWTSIDKKKTYKITASKK